MPVLYHDHAISHDRSSPRGPPNLPRPEKWGRLIEKSRKSGVLPSPHSQERSFEKVHCGTAAAPAPPIVSVFGWCGGLEVSPSGSHDQFAVLPVRILRKAESTLVASKAEVSMKLRSFLRANSFASSISTALTDRGKLGAVVYLLN